MERISKIFKILFTKFALLATCACKPVLDDGQRVFALKIFDFEKALACVAP